MLRGGTDLMETLDISSMLSSTFTTSTGYDCTAHKVGNVVTMTIVIHPTSDLPADTLKRTLFNLPEGWCPTSDLFGVYPGLGLHTVGFELNRDGRGSVLKYSIGGQSAAWTTDKNAYISITYLIGENK